jgi:cell division protein FtsL
MKAGFQQEFKKRFLTSKFLLFFLIIVFIWSVIACIKITYKKKQMVKESEELQAEISKIQEENKQLGSIKNILTNPSFLEKEAKRRLNLKREGEEVVIVPEGEINQVVKGAENEEVEQIGGNSASVESKEETNLRKWWRYFFE